MPDKQDHQEVETAHRVRKVYNALRISARSDDHALRVKMWKTAERIVGLRSD